MAPATLTRQGPLERVASAPSLLGALRAGADLRPQAGAVEAFAAGDALTRLLLTPALPAAVLLDVLEGPDAGEREHAAWALGDRRRTPEALPALRAMATEGGFATMIAELTLDRWCEPPPPRPIPTAPAGGGGLRIVQVFMQGWLDAGLTRPGAGDGGGLATLLVGLSGALAARPEVDEVVTLARAFAGQDAREPVAPGAAIERIAFGGDGYVATADMWPHRRELERGLEQALRRLAPVDAVHLRFADVAALAALRVCERLGLPVVFTLAPDPHALIERREAAGLDRDGFAAADRAEHLLFRARLVERLRDRAGGIALLPRAGGVEQLLGPLGGRRVRTVPEGISTAAIDAALQESAPAPALVAAVQGLPPARRGLPLILSVGRLHRVKGFGRLLEAWAGDPALHAAFNLAIVGGDLEDPTAEERAVLGGLAPRPGLLLLGHRPHAEVARLMVAARGGVYACASEKEEFGMALLEAMAAGLSVVAPMLGGPPTYVEDGVSGAIADTGTVEGLRDGLRRAAAARLDPERTSAAAAVVRGRFTLEAMAAGLVELYAP